MIGFRVLLKYPSHVTELNTIGGIQDEQNDPMILMVKNGVQQNRKVPMMTPKVIAALWSEALYPALPDFGVPFSAELCRQGFIDRLIWIAWRRA